MQSYIYYQYERMDSNRFLAKIRLRMAANAKKKAALQAIMPTAEKFDGKIFNKRFFTAVNDYLAEKFNKHTRLRMDESCSFKRLQVIIPLQVVQVNGYREEQNWDSGNYTLYFQQGGDYINADGRFNYKAFAAAVEQFIAALDEDTAAASLAINYIPTIEAVYKKANEAAERAFAVLPESLRPRGLSKVLFESPITRTDQYDAEKVGEAKDYLPY